MFAWGWALCQKERPGMAGANIDYTTTCHCGRPLHYNDPGIELKMREMVRTQGPLIKVRVSGHTYLVPRHYIALHGIKGHEVPDLGFEETTDD